MTGDPRRYLGKYRGVVVNNVDPERCGRIQVLVPSISNVMPTTWALPCAPVGGIQMGCHTVPLIGAGVWVEFEEGNLDIPIWVGCFWGTAAEVPALSPTSAPLLPAVTIQTPLQNGIIISDDPSIGIVLSTPFATLKINASGITLDSKVAIIASAKLVNINNGALTVQ